MTELVLAHVDLARIRFAHSPVREVVASLGVLHDPGRQCMYGTWLSAVRGRLGGVWLELLIALAPTWSTPPFVAPPPTRPWAVLADELDAITATPPATVRADLEDVYQDRPLPAVLRPLYDDPDRHLTTMVQELDRFWQAAIHPVWRQLRALCMADVAYRMDRFAAGGLVRVLEDLHPELSLDRDRLHIDKPHHRRAGFDFAGMPVRHLLPGLRVMDALHAPHELVWRPEFGPVIFSRITLPPTPVVQLPAGYLRLVEAMCVVQEHTSIPIVMPEELASEEVLDILTTARLLREGVVKGTWTQGALVLRPEAPEDALDAIGPDSALFFGGDEWVVTIRCVGRLRPAVPAGCCSVLLRSIRCDRFACNASGYAAGIVACRRTERGACRELAV